MRDSCLITSHKIALSWNNISLFHKKSEKYVLEKLSGQINSGQFLTIMGPSGAGKSSFLSVLTSKLSAYTKDFRIFGNTTINNQRYTEEQFSSISSYVPQDDLLLETLTVKQTLDFQAKLKLYKLSQFERQERVEQVLKILNLYEIKNSKVGGKQTKSISGGQKKRVIIGVQLISNPSILVLDEPTSGLDSFNSLKIIKILSNLAKKQNKLIIATIHQPSTLMFQNFDKLLVLKNGRQIFLQDASKIVPYMQSLSIKVDERMNPADFFMLELSAYKQTQGHKTMMTYQAWQKYQKQNKKVIINQQFQKIDFKGQEQNSVFKQFQPLFIRNFKTFLRTPSNQFGRIMQMILYPLFLGVLYFDILDKLPQSIFEFQKLQIFLFQFSSFIFLGLFFVIGQTIYDTMLIFPTQKQLVMKQVHSRMYSLNMYYITKLIIQIPGMLIPIWIATIVVYFAAGLQHTFQTFIFYELIFTILSCTGYFIGIIAGILCKQANFAVQASPFIVTPLIIYGGLVVNLKTLPLYSGWLQYLSPLKYCFNALMKNQLSTDKLNHLGDIELVTQQLGLQGTPKDNLINLLLLCYGLFVTSFVILYMRRKFN